MTHIHVTKDGTKIPINELKDSHLLNILKLIERKAISGVTIQSGNGFENNDIWYDEIVLYGEDVFEMANYYEYLNEAERRGLR